MNSPDHGSTGQRNSTIAIVAAILISGALIAGAIVFVSRDENLRTETVTSAQRAWEYAAAGWRCEFEREDGAVQPLTVEALEVFARVENEAQTGDLYAKEPVTCTDPGA